MKLKLKNGKGENDGDTKPIKYWNASPNCLEILNNNRR